MVKESIAFYTRFGSVHRTKEEALRAEREEEQDEYGKCILKKYEEMRNKPSAIGLSGAINWTYLYSDIFLEALDEYGFLTEYLAKRDRKNAR